MNLLLGAVGVGALFGAFRLAAKSSEARAQVAAGQLAMQAAEMQQREFARVMEVEKSRQLSEQLIRQALMSRGVYPAGDPSSPVYINAAQRSAR